MLKRLPYVNEICQISVFDVEEHGSLIEIGQRGHVLALRKFGRVHQLNVATGQLHFLSVRSSRQTIAQTDFVSSLTHTTESPASLLIRAATKPETVKDKNPIRTFFFVGHPHILKRSPISAISGRLLVLHAEWGERVGQLFGHSAVFRTLS